MKLYDLTRQYLELSKLADDPDMPADALTDTLDGITGEIEDKAMGILQVSTSMLSDVTAIDAEIKRLQARKQVIQNRETRLREYLLINMQETGITHIDCPLFQITRVKGRPMVAVQDESQIPDEYIKTVITKSPVKADILKALKAGIDVPGCLLGTGKESLLVK